MHCRCNRSAMNEWVWRGVGGWLTRKSGENSMTYGGIRLVSLAAAGIWMASACGLDPPQAGEADTGLTDVRGQSVMERARPGYDAAGIRAGGFMIYPTASVTEAYED